MLDLPSPFSLLQKAAIGVQVLYQSEDLYRDTDEHWLGENAADLLFAYVSRAT